MNTSHPILRSLFGASILALSLASAPLADTIFTAPADFEGRVSAASAEQGGPIYKGSKAVITGQGLKPGQEITLMRGQHVLNADGPITVDDEGGFSLAVDIDEDAVTGLQPIVVIADNPSAAEIVNLKISPQVPVSGAEKFEIANSPVTRGLYQVAYSPRSDAVFVASAVGRPPVKQSALTKLDANTLEVLAQVEPSAAPERDGNDAGVFALYGVAVDDENGNVWVTNTRQNTVAVYSQEDLSLVKQFEPGEASHARDVVIDEAGNRAYVSATRTGNIEVFDTGSLEKLEPITISSAQRGGEYSAMSLDLDAESGVLVNVSMSTDEAALVDLKSGEVKVIALPGARSASGVAYDPVDRLIFVASQQSDNLLIVDAEKGEVLHDVPVGAQPLNVTFEPVGRLAYVANRGAGTITVVNTDGEIVANLDAGSLPNQLRADGKGNVWAVNKARGEDDPSGDNIWRIAPVAE